MLISKKNRLTIYETVFKEGVMVAAKGFNLQKHPLVEGCTNLEVIKMMQSLKSRGYIRESFAWTYFYWYLTNEGIEYLRTYLNLPPEIIPATLKKQSRAEMVKLRTDVTKTRSEPSTFKAPAADRSGYRKTVEKKADVGAGAANFEFRGGFGRGKLI
uniref:Plectin/eS10 N-terminal domain-containing protein n=1 Tax=Cuerna arida TaxID=1464854 RepID=A0A1B6G058_9HEMI